MASQSEDMKLYNEGKQLLDEKKYIEALETFQKYRTIIGENKSSIDPKEDKHLLYISIAWHEANKKGLFSGSHSAPQNVYIDPCCDWIIKHKADTTNLPPYVERILKKKSGY